MARADNNVLTRFTSGAVGKQLVLRNRGTRSFLSNRPKLKKRRKSSAKQDEIKLRFRMAAKYARKIINDDTLRPDYEAAVLPGQTAYNVAFADFFLGPEISEINTDGYKGAIGDKLIVRALDNFQVTDVAFQIFGADGTEIETGLATMEENGVDWGYTATAANPELTGSIIRVMAVDRPQNRTVLDKLL